MSPLSFRHRAVGKEERKRKKYNKKQKRSKVAVWWYPGLNEEEQTFDAFFYSYAFSPKPSTGISTSFKPWIRNRVGPQVSLNYSPEMLKLKKKWEAKTHNTSSSCFLNNKAGAFFLWNGSKYQSCETRFTSSRAVICAPKRPAFAADVETTSCHRFTVQFARSIAVK